MNKRNIETICPLSPQQTGMLFATLASPDSGVFIEQFTCQLSGELNVSAFKQAWQLVIARHSSLRTAFVWQDLEEPLQVVFRQAELPFERQDWREVHMGERQMRMDAHLNMDRNQEFDLSTAPLLRLALFQLDEQAHQFLWTHHHIMLDGWCRTIILNEVFSFYLSLVKGLDPKPEPARPYRDYIAWLKQQDLNKAESFWRKRLRGFTTPTPLGRPAEAEDYLDKAGEYEKWASILPAQQTELLRALARQHRLTLSTVVQAAWALLLSRYSGERDVMFGTTVSGRPAELARVETMVGLFINTLPLRIKVIREAPFLSWIKQVQARSQENRNYEYCSEGQIHQWSEVRSSLPLYQSIMVFQNYPLDLPSLQLSELEISMDSARTGGAKTGHALTILATAAAELAVYFVYDAGRINAASAELMSNHFLTVLEAIIADPEQKVAALLDGIASDEIPTFKSHRLLEDGTSEEVSSAPRTETEEKLAGIWAHILGIKQVGIHDNFFKMGGHSLLATQLISVVRDIFQVDLPLRTLFDSPTVADLSTAIVQKRAEQADDQMLLQTLAELEAMDQSEVQPLLAGNKQHDGKDD